MKKLNNFLLILFTILVLLSSNVSAVEIKQDVALDKRWTVN